MTQFYSITIEKTDDGYYVEVPSLQGVYAQGDTEDEAVENLKDVLQMTLEDMKERGELFIPQKKLHSISFSSIAVSV